MNIEKVSFQRMLRQLRQILGLTKWWKLKMKKTMICGPKNTNLKLRCKY